MTCKYGNDKQECTSSPMDCQCALDAVFTQREWVGLTDDDLEDIAIVATKGNLHDLRIAIEAKLKEKNT